MKRGKDVKARGKGIKGSQQLAEVKLSNKYMRLLRIHGGVSARDVWHAGISVKVTVGRLALSRRAGRPDALR